MGLGAVRTDLGKRSLGRRIVALAAAYAIALAGLVASFDVARAAAATAADPGSVICHTAVAGHPSPATDGGTTNTCADSCCIGCLMLMAALPPPPADAAPIPQQSSRATAPIETAVVAGTPETRSHQSRAPPQTA